MGARNLESPHVQYACRALGLGTKAGKDWLYSGMLWYLTMTRLTEKLEQNEASCVDTRCEAAKPTPDNIHRFLFQ